MEVSILCFFALIRLSSSENIFCIEGSGSQKLSDGGSRTLSGNACEQPILHGLTRYGFNAFTQSCQPFSPGCQTNANNFKSMEECQNTCGSDHMKLNVGVPGVLGVKWCGPGSEAVAYDDLGYSKETDACCRAHDNCPNLILAGESKHNLTNDAYYTRLSCECDEQFRKCLHKAGTTLANQVGRVYFDGLATQCFRKDYPIKSCKSRGGFLYRKCLEYELDRKGKKSYQWFSVPNYEDTKTKKLKQNTRMRYQKYG